MQCTRIKCGKRCQRTAKHKIIWATGTVSYYCGYCARSAKSVKFNIGLTFSKIAAVLLLCMPASADIYRWDNGQVIPGTEGITPGPGANLSNLILPRADLSNMDLTGANFQATGMDESNISGSTLTNANFKNAGMYKVDLSNVQATGASFYSATTGGSNFSGSNFTGANFRFSAATGDFTNTILINAYLPVYITADLTGAVIHGATLPHINLDQLYSTASYQQKDLHGIDFTDAKVFGGNFRGQDLSGAIFSRTPNYCYSLALASHVGLYQADLTNADVTGVDFTDVCIEGVTFSGARGYIPVGLTRVPGDSNGDGWFNSGDLVTVFTVGEYEDSEAGNSTFEDGDWNGDGDFNTSDLVTAFSVGAYEPQSAPAAVAVPEPTGNILWMITLSCVVFAARRLS